jgi:chaperonin GroEL
MSDLGKASKVVIKKNMTVLMNVSEVKDAIDMRVADLKHQVLETTDANDREFLKERIANISGGVGVIYVGALSDIEQKEKRDRIDDAVCAVMAAMEDGILPGGGVALLNCLDLVMGDSIAQNIMFDTLSSPFNQILINAGKDPHAIKLELAGIGEGYDVKNEVYGNMMKMGIIDPTKVTKNALLNAVSVATTIMSTNAIITNIRDYEGSK